MKRALHVKNIPTFFDLKATTKLIQKDYGAQKRATSPSFTVCFAASIQSTEVVKLLRVKPHLQAPLMVDLWEYELISL